MIKLLMFEINTQHLSLSLSLKLRPAWHFRMTLPPGEESARRHFHRCNQWPTLARKYGGKTHRRRWNQGSAHLWILTPSLPASLYKLRTEPFATETALLEYVWTWAWQPDTDWSEGPYAPPETTVSRTLVRGFSIA